MTHHDGVVLVIADATDTTADRVCHALASRGSRMFRFDTAEFPGQLQVRVELEGTRWRGELARDGDRVDLDDIRSVYVRRPRPFEIRAHLTVAEQWHAATECRYGLGGCLTSLPVPYLNHPSRAADAAYKPRQLKDLRSCGLTTPPTLVTNSADAVREFATEHGPLVCKSIAASVLHTGDTSHVVYTRHVSPNDLSDLDGIDYHAHLFQPFIESVYAVRLTVVGQRFFPVRIDAGSDQARVDWRSDYHSLNYQIVDIPPDIKSGVADYMKLAGLAYGAFDFLVRSDQSLVALECNPEGNYSWLEEETALPISDAIADFLMGDNRS